MNKFLKFLTFSLFAALIIFASCGGGDDDDDNNDDGPGTDPTEDIVNNLIADGGDWAVTEGGVTLESVAAEGWESFSLKLSGSTSSISFSTSGAADPTVWPGSGTWSFVEGSDGKKALRAGDNIEIDITASANSLRLEFDITEGRSKGIVGRWSFTLQK